MKKLVLVLLLLLCVQSIGGEEIAEKVTFGWLRITDSQTIGYHVYIGNDTGRYSWMVDVGYNYSLTISCIEETFVIVRPYDRHGIEGPNSNEVVYTPRVILDPKARPSASPVVSPTPIGPLIIITMKKER